MFYSNVYSIHRSSNAIGEQLMNTLIISCCTLGIVFSIVSSITDISLECGFNNLSYFNKLFKRKYHLTPREFRDNI